MGTDFGQFTLEHFKKEYYKKEQEFLRQVLVGAPGLGKNVFGNSIRDLGLQVDSYVFSKCLEAFGERYPKQAKIIAEEKAKGNMVPREIVLQTYLEDLGEKGFNIEGRLKEGTIIYDGFPRFVREPGVDQVAILREAHDSQDPIFNLATILHHNDPYVPAIRQLLREYGTVHRTGDIGRADTYKAPKRILEFEGDLPDLEKELETVSEKLISFRADNTTPDQNALIYFAMAAADMVEAEVRELPEFARLGRETRMANPYDSMKRTRAKPSSITSTDMQTRVDRIEQLVYFTLAEQHAGTPFNEYATSFAEIINSYGN